MENSTSPKAEGHSDLLQPIPQSFGAAIFENLESRRKQSPNGYFCPACGTLSTAFKKGGTSGRSNAKCPVCGTLERHRLFWVYFVNSIWPRLPKGTKKLLHIAPEPIFTRLFQSSDSIEYLSGDLTMPSAMIRLDLTNIQLPNDQFDVIVCLHIMEHIPDDRKAMTEMFRVTKPGGFLLVMVPTYGQKTYEDSNITAPEERLIHFGQEDHVRKYGTDIMDRLSAVGFKVSIWPKAEELDAQIAEFIGSGRRIIFECRKEK